jgi:hypothetical protein
MVKMAISAMQNKQRFYSLWTPTKNIRMWNKTVSLSRLAFLFVVGALLTTLLPTGLYAQDFNLDDLPGSHLASLSSDCSELPSSCSIDDSAPLCQHL